MHQWFVLYRKEMKEMWRNFKWIWVPVVFIILGMMQPISLYFLPEIMKVAGNLPEGAIIQIPTPTGGETLIQVLSQYGSIGILILVLSAMGSIASEKQSGVIDLVMVRPVSATSYVTSKWAAYASLTMFAFLIGYMAGWYYTEVLIDGVEMSRVIASALIYVLWLLFILSLTLLFSAWLKSNGGIAFLALGSSILLTMLTALFTRPLAWSPANLVDHAYAVLLTGNTGENWIGCFIVSLLLIVAILMASVKLFKLRVNH